MIRGSWVQEGCLCTPDEFTGELGVMFAAVGWPFLELKEGRSLLLTLPATVLLLYV